MSIQRLGRAVFAAAVCLILPASAFAQQVGVKVGINSASLTPEEEDEAPLLSRRLGPVGGVWIRTALTSHLSLQTGGLFSEKGVKVDISGLVPDGSVDIRLRYFEIPLLARADFADQRASARLFVVGGAAPAFKLSARSKLEAEGEEQTRDSDDDFYSLDVGLVGGLGLEFGRAQVEARYTHGLRHINTDDNGDDRIKNRVFSVTVGFRLR